MQQLRHQWKKVFESDLDYVVSEFKDLVRFPALVILSGEPGAGKTTLVKKITQLLGNKKGSDGPSSPSYSLINDYGNILHADLYRLESGLELEHLEFELYFEGKELVLIEWGKKFLPQLEKLMPEGFNVFEMIMENEDPKKNKTRNYSFYSFSD